MAKTDDKRYGDVNRQAQDRENQLMNTWAPERQNVGARAQGERATLTDQYNTFNKTGGVDSEALARSRRYIDDGLGGIGDYGSFGGGTSGPSYSAGLTGGSGDHFGEAYGVFSDLGRNGGIAGVDLNAVREPLEGYRNFADTGGISEGEKGDIRSRSISPLGSLYSNQRNNLDRMRSVQGGYSPGFNAASNELTRMQGQSASDAMRATEMDIADRVRSGKLSGLQGIGDTQMNAESLNLAQQEATQRGRLGGASGMAGIGGQRTNRDLAMSQMDQSAAASNAAAGAADARFRAAQEQAYRMAGVGNEQQHMDRFQQGSMYGTQGLQGLYDGPGSGEARALDAQMLGAAEMFGNQDMNRLQATRGTGVDWGRIAGAGAGILAAPMTGGTSLLGMGMGR